MSFASSFGTEYKPYEPTAEMFWIPVVTLYVLNNILMIWTFCFQKMDNSHIDTMFGPMFANSAIAVIIVRAAQGGNVTPRMIFTTVPVIIWAVRLALHIGIRHQGEDYRYKQMREGSIKKCGLGCFTFLSWLLVYIGQANAAIAVNSSVLYVNLYSSPEDYTFNWLDLVGLSLWLLGFVMESMADHQLKVHLANPKPGTGKFIKTGWWRYSRHPNYFGEACMWTGLYLVACNVPGGWITMWAPLTITCLVRFISGVPFPEKKYKDHPEWIQYCKETNIFCPWFANVEKNPEMNQVQMSETQQQQQEQV